MIISSKLHQALLNLRATNPYNETNEARWLAIAEHVEGIVGNAPAPQGTTQDVSAYMLRICYALNTPPVNRNYWGKIRAMTLGMELTVGASVGTWIQRFLVVCSKWPDGSRLPINYVEAGYVNPGYVE